MKRTLISGSDKLGGISEKKNKCRFQLTAILLDIIPNINLTGHFIIVRKWLNIQEHAYTHEYLQVGVIPS